MADFEQAIPFALKHEDPDLTGEVEDVAGDSGGRTRFGIAETSNPYMPEGFYSGEMPRDEALAAAEAVYRRNYWDANRLGEIEDQTVATKVLDMAIHMGSHQAVVLAQRACCSLGSTLVEDGKVGPATLAAINGADPVALLGALRAFSAAFYRHIAEVKPQDQKFLRGWLIRANA